MRLDLFKKFEFINHNYKFNYNYKYMSLS